MIRSLLSKTYQSNINSLLRTFKRFKGNVAEVLREEDKLTQKQIDSILGNDYQQHPTQSLDNLHQNDNSNLVNSQLFYNLIPIKNTSFPECKDPGFVELVQTPNQNIMNILGIQVQNSFEDYCNQMKQIWSEDELYGDITPIRIIDPKSLEFRDLLTVNSKYLQALRKQFVVNLNIPGSIEGEDPRNFMELRPVQQFRHTPLIPISDSAKRQHQEMLDRYHRKQFIFEISNEKIVNFFLVSIVLGIGGYMIYLILSKQEERTVSYMRLKHNRRLGTQEVPTFRI